VPKEPLPLDYAADEPTEFPRFPKSWVTTVVIVIALLLIAAFLLTFGF
jgi:hypothetical protein